MLSELQQYLRTAASARRQVDVVGPFTATFTPSHRSPFLNYAIPEEGARPTPAEVEALCTAFTERGLKPRLEYLDALAPDLEAALLAAGFAVEDRLAAMTCRAVPDDVPLPAGVELVVPDTREDVRAMLEAQHAAYEDDGPSEADLDRSEAGAARGDLRLLARDVATGAPAGGGVATRPDGFTEVAGIGVVKGFRRRGIAAAMTAALTRAALAGGAHTAFLTPADDDVARAYVRAGYERTSRMLHVSRS